MAEKNQAKWRGVRPTAVSSLTSGQKTVGSTDTEVLDSNTNRDYAYVKNIGTVDVYVRPASTITISNGELLKPQGYVIYEGYTGKIHAIRSTTDATVYYEEG